MPIPLAAIGLGLGGAGQIASMFGSRSASKKAEKAAREQQKLDAMLNLISVAGGQGTKPIGAVQSAAPLDIGGALQGAGSLAMAGGDLQNQALDRTRQTKLDKAAEKAFKSLADLRAAQTQAVKEGRGSGSSIFGSQFKAN